MPARKKPKNYGQQFFSQVQKDVEANYQSRPVGMPALSVLTTEMARYGLPESDAQYLYDRWLANGFKIRNQKIKDWKAAFRTFYYDGWLPSQKGIAPNSGLESYPTHARVEAWCIKKKKSQLTSRAWGELMTGRFRGRLITNQTDFEAALEVILAQWLKEP